MALKASSIIAISIGAILLGVLLPIALNGLLAFTSPNATVQTMVSVILPIIAVIGIIMFFVPRGESE